MDANRFVFLFEVVEASRPPQLGFAIYIRLHLGEFLVALVAQFGVALGGDEEFFGLLEQVPRLHHGRGPLQLPDEDLPLRSRRTLRRHGA